MKYLVRDLQNPSSKMKKKYIKISLTILMIQSNKETSNKHTKQICTHTQIYIYK